MRAYVSGTITELDRNEWTMNGRNGVTYSIFVAQEGQSARTATRVRVSNEQYPLFTEGMSVELPVNLFANTVERGGVITGAKLSCTLDESYVASLHAVSGV